MKEFIVCFITSLVFGNSYSQDMTRFNLYKPGENAEEEINKAVEQAKAQGKHVFIDIGGNWSVWCARFNDFIKNDEKIDSIMRSNYVVYHLNYSKENYNAKLLAKYGYPQRFGFPVFLILDNEGKLIHTQNSEYLFEGSSYYRVKVISFFNGWSPKALDPKQYTEQ